MVATAEAYYEIDVVVRDRGVQTGCFGAGAEGSLQFDNGLI